MITAITSTSLEKELPYMMQRLNPKPDIWIINIDKNPLIGGKDPYDRLFERLSKIYNKLKRMVPDKTSHVAIIESDCVTPPDTLKRLKNYLDNNDNVDIVTIAARHRHAHYYGKYCPFPMVWRMELRKDKPQIRYWLNYSGTRKVDSSSLNFVLLKKEPLDEVDFEGYDEQSDLSIDDGFFIKTKFLGYVTHCDFDIPTVHQGVRWNGYVPEIKHEWNQKSDLKIAILPDGNFDELLDP